MACFAVALTARPHVQGLKDSENRPNVFSKPVRHSPYLRYWTIDKSLFGAMRILNGKTAVFASSSETAKSQIYTGSVPACSKPDLQGIIRTSLDGHTLANSDAWRGCNARVGLDQGH